MPPIASPAADALRGAVCIITGGSRTLGAVIARRMAAYGARVAVNYHRSEQAALDLCAELAAAGATAVPVAADVTDAAQAERLLAEVSERLGPPDVLVNNVGPYVDTPFLDLPLGDFDRVMAGNVRATFVLSQAAGRIMKRRGSGLILNIAATDFAHRSHSVYGLAKAGVIYLTEALALELAPEVRVHALAPDLMADNEEMGPEIAAPAVAATPMGRLVTRAEVAEAACQICAPAFAMATGHTLVLDGGRSIPRIALGRAGGAP